MAVSLARLKDTEESDIMLRVEDAGKKQISAKSRSSSTRNQRKIFIRKLQSESVLLELQTSSGLPSKISTVMKCCQNIQESLLHEEGSNRD